MINTNTKNCEVNDKELEQVTGGVYLQGEVYQSPDDVKYLFGIGQKVEFIKGYFLHLFTKQCTVIDRKIDASPDKKGFCAWYKVYCDDSEYNNNWYPEAGFEGGCKNFFTV